MWLSILGLRWGKVCDMLRMRAQSQEAIHVPQHGSSPDPEAPAMTSNQIKRDFPLPGQPVPNVSSSLLLSSVVQSNCFALRDLGSDWALLPTAALSSLDSSFLIHATNIIVTCSTRLQ